MKNFKKVLGVFVFIMVAVLILPKTVFAETDVLDKVLTNGKLVVNSIEPKDISQAWSLIVEDKLMDVEGIWVDWDGSFNSNFTKCTIYYGQHGDKSKSKEVEIVYNYDKDIKAIVDAMVSKLPEDKTKFELTDLEYINYLLYNSENEDHFNLGDFSGQLKKAINYKNFNFVIDNRAGSGSSFSISQMGIAKIQYNNTTYYIESMLGVSAKNIFYVNDNVQDVKKAIEDRITKVFGKVNIEVSDGQQTVGESYDIEKEMYQNQYRSYKNIIDNYSSADDYADARELEGWDRMSSVSEYYYAESIINTYSTEDAYITAHMSNLSFLNEIRDAEVYVLCIGDEGLIVPFAVVKDSSKINDDLNYTTNDAKTNITISTSSSTLPLDTLIKVIKLTSGTEYEKIMKLLEVTNSETYDLSLYSNSIDKYITKLDNGKFEVKIPISESLKDKDLIVYYVDENGEVIEYEVTTKDGYAIFTTDHFSVYTLASKTSDNNPVVPSAPTTNNPQTGDNVGLYIGTLLISIVGLISGTLYLKRKKIARSN